MLDTGAAVPYNKSTVIEKKASQWFNPNMFTLPTRGFAYSRIHCGYQGTRRAA